MRGSTALLAGATVGLSLMVAPVQADGSECGTVEAWQAWTAANRSTIVKADKHLQKAVRLAKQQRKYSKIVLNLRNAGRHLSTVTPSPDYYTSSDLLAAAEGFGAAANAAKHHQNGRLKRDLMAALDGWNSAQNDYQTCKTELHF